MSFGSLIFAGDALKPENGRFYQTLQERVTTISSDLLFFTLELNRLDDAVLEKKFASKALARWRPWIFSDFVATRIVTAHHGDSSGVRGAARLWST
jgi:oligoendopeptidase F